MIKVLKGFLNSFSRTFKPKNCFAEGKLAVISVDLLQVSLAAKTGEGMKARETCNTW